MLRCQKNRHAFHQGWLHVRVLILVSLGPGSIGLKKSRHCTTRNEFTCRSPSRDTMLSLATRCSPLTALRSCSHVYRRIDHAVRMRVEASWLSSGARSRAIALPRCGDVSRRSGASEIVGYGRPGAGNPRSRASAPQTRTMERSTGLASGLLDPIPQDSALCPQRQAAPFSPVRRSALGSTYATLRGCPFHRESRFAQVEATMKECCLPHHALRDVVKHALLVSGCVNGAKIGGRARHARSCSTRLSQRRSHSSTPTSSVTRLTRRGIDHSCRTQSAVGCVRSPPHHQYLEFGGRRHGARGSDPSQTEFELPSQPPRLVAEQSLRSIPAISNRAKNLVRWYESCQYNCWLRQAPCFGSVVRFLRAW